MRAPARTFTDLDAWKHSHALVLEIYRLTRGSSERERFGLTGRLRRSAVSLPAAIAEGFRKYTSADKARSINIAEGSCEECSYCCIVAQVSGYGHTTSILEAMDVVAGHLAAAVRRLRQQGVKVGAEKL